MTVRDRLRAASRELRAAGVPDPEYDSAMLLSFLTGRPPLELRLETGEELTEEQERDFRALLLRRKSREPLQYLIGTAVFCGFEFLTAPGVLIPRPETELLAEWAAKRLEGRDAPEILDLCCGSGCIGLSLAKWLPGARVTLTDLSPEAVRLTESNRKRIGVQTEVVSGDLFAPAAGRRFDLIVSNPPYIPSAECDSLQPEVLHEPRLALDGGADGLDFYRRIVREAGVHLKRDGLLLMEVGEGEAETVAEWLRISGAGKTEIRKDDAGISRMVLGEFV